MKDQRPLTELEGTVLGVVWTRQPCTPYQVRREFLNSPSPYWSGSAGAIYPLMRRLEAAGLVRSSEHAAGARTARRYQVTEAGRQELRRWVGPPLSEIAVGVPPDPLRVRIAFLDVLTPEERLALVRDAVESVRRHLAAAEQAQQASYGADTPGFMWMGRGAVAMLQARLRWIEEVGSALENEGGKCRGKTQA